MHGTIASNETYMGKNKNDHILHISLDFKSIASKMFNMFLVEFRVAIRPLPHVNTSIS